MKSCPFHALFTQEFAAALRPTLVSAFVRIETDVLESVIKKMACHQGGNSLVIGVNLWNAEIQDGSVDIDNW